MSLASCHTVASIVYWEVGMLLCFYMTGMYRYCDTSPICSCRLPIRSAAVPHPPAAVGRTSVAIGCLFSTVTIPPQLPGQARRTAHSHGPTRQAAGSDPPPA